MADHQKVEADKQNKSQKNKKDKARKEELEKEICRLLDLKAELEDEPQGKQALKVPKGTRDYHHEQTAMREAVLSDIVKIFKRHGAQSIDTPVFELKSVLTGKYGDDSKLIYDLKDQGGEILSLRYDLTVPFARFVAMNKITSIKRYHIAKVYRRDNPAMTRGRYREFFQCDFDIAGAYDSMVPDAECIRIIMEVIRHLDPGAFLIKINHRKILDGMFEICGVPMDKYRTICSSVDKLDKTPWKEVREEMIDQKGLSPEVADEIGEKIKLHGNVGDVIRTLKSKQDFMNNKCAKEGIEDIELLYDYCLAMGVEDSLLSLDLSLARGLDYYSGVIFETVMTGVDDKDAAEVGSVAAGGRYDHLVGMFDPKKRMVPCVGVSFGVERLFTILENKDKYKKASGGVQVFVASVQKGLTKEKMEIMKELWESSIRAEYSYKSNQRLLHQLQYCETSSIPWAIIIGGDEIEKGIVKIRQINDRSEVEVPRSKMVEELRQRLAIDSDKD